MRTLDQLVVRNFKSIREQTLKLEQLNVFIGANGSGKSNLVSVFPFVRHLLQRELQFHTGVVGGADRILHFGRKRSPFLAVEMQFGEVNVVKGYRFKLVPTESDRFVFKEECYWVHELSDPQPLERKLGTGHPESLLMRTRNDVVALVAKDLFSYRLYHFHDTSPDAKLKQTGDIHQNRVLNSNGSNLAAFLFRLQQTNPDSIELIEDTVRQVAPYFGGFELHPTPQNNDVIRFEWRHRGSDESWSANALSDGTLRFICLCSLLLQPELPGLILLDEPELGLHPAAIVVLAALLKSASTRSQVLLATQSVTLLNQFTPDSVIVAEREDEATTFRRLSELDQKTWVDGFALGELWEMNAVGGRP